MISFNEWHIIHEAIDRKTCKKIISLGKDSFKPAQADLHIESKEDKERINEYGVDKDTRVSDISWITNVKWVKDLIIPALASANVNAGWKYNVIGVESLQLTRYKKDGFYTWHSDGKGCHLSGRTYGKDPNPYVRKLSMTILLNDSYEGGEFQFASYNKKECMISTPEFSKVGSSVVFPSVMEHRVVPVKKGTRYSLVGWFIGPPFV